MLTKPSLRHFVEWLRTTKSPDKQYVFESPTNCLVAHYIKENWDPKTEEMPRFEGGNWSALFPGKDYMGKLVAYHDVANAKPMTFKDACQRMNNECAKWSF